MRISQDFAADMRWLVKDEGWDDDARDLARNCLKKDPGFFTHFFETYIAARRKGYKMFEGPQYMKLAEFCAGNGLSDPYRGDAIAAQWDAQYKGEGK
jgi:hypothetical protein